MKKQTKIISSFLAILFILMHPLSSLALTIYKIDYTTSKSLIIKGEYELNENMKTMSLSIEPTISNSVYKYNYWTKSGDNYWEASFENIDLKPEKYIISASVKNIVGETVYEKVEYDNGQIIKLNNPGLEFLIRHKINKPTGNILKSDVENIVSLDARNFSCVYAGHIIFGIKSLDGIECLTNLEKLDLAENKISDITPLSNLINLKELNLSNNQISDIRALSNLTNLHKLNLGDNKINDITLLSNLVNLEHLNLHSNPINDISVLSNLSNLHKLNLRCSKTKDITPLSNLVNLQELDLGSIISFDPALTHIPHNQITDISSLSNLTNLHKLDLRCNKINDISSLSNLVNLEVLNLSNNQISDISALNNLNNLDQLDISNNQIVDINPKNQNNNIQSTSRKSSNSLSKSKNTTTVKSTHKATIKSNDAEIQIPANATNDDIKIKIEKVNNSSKLKTKSNQKYTSDICEITKDKKGNFNKPITITLPFDKSKVDLDKYNLGIFWFNEETKEWIELDNIKVDTNKNKVSGDVNHFTKFAVLATEKIQKESIINLTDISSHWAERNIKKLVEDSVITGYKDDTFKPDKNITKAEFCNILVQAFKLDIQEGKVFTDTENHWAKDVIATAQANGIVSGYNNETFKPDDLITREEMATMIVRAATLNFVESNQNFNDNNDISLWAKDSIITAVENKILIGYPGNTLKPKGYATRAEAVTMILNALK